MWALEAASILAFPQLLENCADRKQGILEVRQKPPQIECFSKGIFYPGNIPPTNVSNNDEIWDPQLGLTTTTDTKEERER